MLPKDMFLRRATQIDAGSLGLISYSKGNIALGISDLFSHFSSVHTAGNKSFTGCGQHCDEMNLVEI